MEQFKIDVVDIVNATRIIEAAIDRGTFKANEMSGVAGVYDKFASFVKQQEELAAEAESADTSLSEEDE
ncbi:hypothetical protein NVP2275O_396 [Vibrio phage 2.275.O._10N.286.54.E11]|nr:hypothetical protein NVP2275O_396 [Vibrio phage 2.275.O._10N.286.54.E11]